MSHSKIALSIIVAATQAALASGPATASNVEGPFDWGRTKNVYRYERFWIAGQPDRAGARAASEAGIDLVIDLRAPGERTASARGDEASAFQSFGIDYQNVPIHGADFDPIALARIEALVRAEPDRKILVHCASGNRAAGWLATHLVEERGMSADEAMAIARSAGITHAAIENGVRSHLSQSGGASFPISGPKELIAQARSAHDAIAPLRSGLSTALTTALRGDASDAIDSCQVEAGALSSDASTGDMRVGRTSHRLRNPANAPAPWLEEQLRDFLTAPVTPAIGRVVDLGEQGIGYVEPIYTRPMCLTCHGHEGSEVSSDVMREIRKRYPQDRATGFANGELRGLFWVQQPPTEAQNE